MKIEFYLDKTKTFKKVINLKWDDQEWQELNKLSVIQIEMIFDNVAKFPKARKAFMHLSQSKDINTKKEILSRFIYCNWTKLDNKYDITDNNLQFENIDCPFKGTNNCLINGEGIVCIKGSK